ncbi:MAG: 1,6-anhydro-N-acetylmuramyl-L-alanine amidase AmpD [Gammaproteobacteria bacterium]
MAAILSAIEIDDGWVRGARRVPSPNADARPPGVEIALVIVHSINLPPGEFGGPWIERLFMNTLPASAHPYFRELVAARVSAHVLVQRDGSLIQFAPFGARAWHAGASTWAGRSNCNDYSVGIEVEGCDDVPYSDRQYRRLAALVASLRRVYPTIAPDAVVGHSDVAPGRKTDPGAAFDWARFQAAGLTAS